MIVLFLRRRRTQLLIYSTFGKNFQKRVLTWQVNILIIIYPKKGNRHSQEISGDGGDVKEHFVPPGCLSWVFRHTTLLSAKELWRAETYRGDTIAKSNKLHRETTNSYRSVWCRNSHAIVQYACMTKLSYVGKMLLDDFGMQGHL
jgi:hypothetical protein